MATYTERLKLVQDAIDGLIASGQSVTYQGRTLTMASLNDLLKLEERYKALADAEQDDGTGGRSRLIYVTPVD